MKWVDRNARQERGEARIDFIYVYWTEMEAEAEVKERGERRKERGERRQERGER